MKKIAFLLGCCLVFSRLFAQISTEFEFKAPTPNEDGLYGFKTVPIGDINQDGFNDMATTEPAEGKVYIYYGTPTGLEYKFFITETVNTWFGWDVVSGDFNDDDKLDLAISATGTQPYNVGQVFVYYCPTNGFSANLKSSGEYNPNPNWQTTGATCGQNYGFSLAVGDIDGDGDDDLAIGARNGYSLGTACPSSTAKSGVYVFHGGTPGLQGNNQDGSSADWYDEHDASSGGSRLFGQSVAFGNLNGTGGDELIVGDPKYHNGSNEVGRVEIYEGQSNLPYSRLTGITGNTNSMFGQAVCSGSDIDGDGMDDLLVGAPKYEDGTDDYGKTFLFYGVGSPSWTTYGDDDWEGRLTGPLKYNSLFGLSLTILEDFNGDGDADFAVGARGYNSEEGLVRVYYGDGSQSNNYFDFTDITGSQTASQFGRSLNDFKVTDYGRSMLSVSAPKQDINGESDAGQTDLYFHLDKAHAGTSVTVADIDKDGDDDYAYGSPGLGKVSVYYSTPFKGQNIYFDQGSGNTIETIDINKDGFLDLTIGSPNYDENKGRVLVVFGGQEVNDVVLTNEFIVIEGTLSDSYFGYEIENLGNVYEPDYDVLAIGAPGDASNSGSVYLFRAKGNSQYVAGSLYYDSNKDWVFTKPANSQFGFSIAGGNLDNSSKLDMAVGDPLNEEVFVYHHDVVTNAYKQTQSAKIELSTNHTSGINFGFSIASGNLNGFGADELAIGAPDLSGNLSNGGEVFVFEGGGALSGSLDETNSLWTSTIGINQQNASFGYALTLDQDFDGDFMHDLAVGSPGYDDVSNQNVGAVVIYKGDFLNNFQKVDQLEKNEAGAELGSSISYRSDINNDKVSEILAGCPQKSLLAQNDGGLYALMSQQSQTIGDANLGMSFDLLPDYTSDALNEYLVAVPGRREVRIYNGTMKGMGSDIIWSHTFGGHGELTVANIGDVNHDGKADIAVGDHNYNNGDGVVFLFFGSGQSFRNAPDIYLIGQNEEHFGFSIAGEGDITTAASADPDDRIDDLVIGAPGTTANGGAVYVWKGSTTFGNLTSGLAINATTSGYWKLSPSTLPSTNQYGYCVNKSSEELIFASTGKRFYIGDPKNDKVYGYFANNTPPSTLEFECQGESNTRFGHSVSSSSESGEIAIGAPNKGTSSNDGEVLILNVYPSGSYNTASLSTYQLETLSLGSGYTGAQFGWSLDFSNDVNNDGENDLLVGAPYYNNGEGVAHLYFNELYKTWNQGHVEEYEAPNSGNFGYLVRTHRLDNDDAKDVIVAAPYEANPGSGDGNVHSYFNRSSEGVLGANLSSAGDVNGDGYSDYIASLGGTNETWVYYGGPDGASSEPAWTYRVNSAFISSSTGEVDGGSVSSAGDINGDGYSDIIIGNARHGKNHGAVYIFTGSSSGLSEEPVWTAYGDDKVQQLGYDVACVGDIDGDQKSDIVIGEPLEGRVHVWYGKDITTSGNVYNSTHSSWSYSTTGTSLGKSVSSAGDFNGDGHSDFIVGDPGNGKAYLFIYDKANSTLPSQPTWTSDWTAGSGGTTAPSGTTFGGQVAGIGDVNGDGFSDIAISDVNATSSTIGGKVYVWLGNSNVASMPAYPNDANWSTGNGANQADCDFGLRISGIGDHNGDGFADMAVSAPRYLQTGSGRVGLVKIYHGTSNSSTILDEFNDVNDDFKGSLLSEGFGFAVSSLGDVNGDGLSDFGITSKKKPNEDFEPNGRVNHFLGQTNLLSETPSDRFTMSDLESFGYIAQTAGDVNGDGFDDLLVTAPIDPHAYSGSNTASGVAYVFKGRADGKFNSTYSWSCYSSNQNDAYIGFSATSGDVNGDGFSDIIIGAPNLEGCRAANNDGVVAIFYGSVNDIIRTSGAVVNRELVWVSSGSSLWRASGNLPAMSGGREGYGHHLSTTDLNGDGYMDIIGTASAVDEGNNSYVSKVFIYYGGTSLAANDKCARGQFKSAQASVTADIVITRPMSSWIHAVNAGDLNGDGYGDLAISYQDVANQPPVVEVFYGQCNGFCLGDLANSSCQKYVIGTSDLPNWKSNITATYDTKFGFDIVALNDANGDGYGDLAIGAPLYTNGTGLGAVFVLQGSTNGLPGNNDGTINDLLSTSISPNICTITSNIDNSFGFSICAGDFNGSGYTDLAVSSKFWKDASDDYSYQLYAFSAEGNGAGFNSGLVLNESNADWTYDIPASDNYISSLSAFGSTAVGFGEEGRVVVGSAGDYNGDGYADLVVGVPFAKDLDATTTEQPEILLFTGNATGGLSLNTIQYNEPVTNQSDKMVQTGTKTTACNIYIGQKAHSHLGRSRGTLQWEVVTEGQSFATPTGLPTAMSNYSEGPFNQSAIGQKNSSYSDISSAIVNNYDPWKHSPSSQDILNLYNTLTAGTDFSTNKSSYNWRCRVAYDPSMCSDGQLYSRWFYSGIGDDKVGNFRMQYGSTCRSSCGGVPPLEENENEVSIIELDEKLVGCRVYPNPARNELSISSKDEIQMVSVYDINGKLAKELTGVLVNKMDLDITDLSEGLYTIRIQTEAEIFVERFVKN